MNEPLEVRQMEAVRTGKLTLPSKSGGSSAENRYGQLYQRMVRRGEAPQLRAKYRA